MALAIGCGPGNGGNGGVVDPPPGHQGDEDGGTGDPDGGPGGDGDGGDGGENGDEDPKAETCVVPVSVTPPREGTWTLPPLQPCIQTYHLDMPEEVLAEFEADVYTPDREATFTVDGVSWKAEVRLRGQSARHFPKKSWNIDLNDGRFEGRRRLNLSSQYMDQTMLTEKLAYDMLFAMGVPAPRTKFVRLYVNGRYEGLFLDIEQVDKHFAKARLEFADDDPTIYRTPRKDNEMKTWRGEHQGDWEKKTNEDEPHDDVHALMARMNFTPEPRFAEELSQRFDLEGFLLSMAMDVLISNSYQEDSQSYLIHDRAQDLWRYVPWDLNNNDARWWHTYPLESVDYPYFKHPLVNFTITDKNVEYIYNRRVDEWCGTGPCYPGYLPTFSNLGSRIVLNPALAARLRALVEKGMKDFFNEGTMFERIDALHALIKPHVAGRPPEHRDPYMDLQKFALGPQFVKNFVRQRIAFIERELPKVGKLQSELILTKVDPAQGWVEVKNVGSAALDLGGRTLTNNVRHGLLKNLPPHPLAPGETLQIHMTALGVPMDPDGEVGLFDGETILGFHDALFYGQLEEGMIYARDQEGRWQIVSRPP